MRRWKPGILIQLVMVVLLMLFLSGALVHHYDSKRNESRHQEQTEFLRSATLETLSLLEAQEHVQAEKSTLQEGLDGETNYDPQILRAAKKVDWQGHSAIRKAEKVAESFRQRRERNGPDHPENHDLFLCEDMVRQTIECLRREASDLHAFRVIVEGWAETKRLTHELEQANGRLIIDTVVNGKPTDTASERRLIKEADELASSLEGVAPMAETPRRKRRYERMAEQLRAGTKTLQRNLKPEKPQ